MTRQRRAMAGFGQALTSVGAQFLEIITKIDIDNQLSEFEGVTTEQINSAIAGYVNDPEPVTYLKRFDPQLEAIQKENLGKVKNPQARRIAENWFKKRSAGWQKQVQSMAFDRVEQNAKESVNLAEFRAIQQRDPEIINRPVTRAVQNGVMGKDEASLIIEQTHYKILLGQIEDEALETIYAERARGTEVGMALARGLATIEERRKEITSADKNQISTKVERSFMWTLSGEIAREEEIQVKNEDDVEKLVLDKSAPIEEFEVAVQKLDEEKQELWKKRAIDESKKKPPLTDWKGYLEAEKMVTDYHTGKITQKEVIEALKELRFDKRKMSQEEYDALSYRLNKKYPRDISVAMENAMKSNKRKIGGMVLWGKENQNLAGVNQALIDWIDENLEKVKRLDVKDIYSYSANLAAMVQSSESEKKALPPLPPREFYESHPEAVPKGIEAYRTAGQEPPDWMLKLAGKEITAKEKEPKTLPKPKTKAEYDKLKSGTKYIDPDGVERIKK